MVPELRSWLNALGRWGGLSHPCYAGAVGTAARGSRRSPGSRPKVSERLQEFDDRLLIRLTQLLEVAGDIARLATMAEDRFSESERSAIVHQHRMGAHDPGGRGAPLVGARMMVLERQVLPFDLVHFLAVVLFHGDGDAVAGADIVEEVIAVGMEALVAERFRNGELAAVHHRASRRGDERRDMTDLTADPRKQRLALPRRGGRGLPGVARRGLGGAHEAREVIDVREPVGLGLVVRLAHRVAEAGHLVRSEEHT